MPRALDSWVDVGRRVAEAREASGLTQGKLASQIELQRTALAKIELGCRTLSSLELARLASALQRPIEWFVTESPPSVVSRRSEHADRVDGLDAHIDTLARDVELLLELKSLPAVAQRNPQVPASLEQAERLAAVIRQEIGRVSGPIHDLAAAVQPLGLYVASVDLAPQLPDGAYVALEGAGVAVVNGGHDAARRRFTLTHELGHHVMADEYSTDLSVSESKEERERRINAFAVHFLMPRDSVTRDWATYGGGNDPRDAAIRLAVDYRVSWTAVCGHLPNLGVIDAGAASEIRRQPPTRSDYLEHGLYVVEELAPPSLSPAFTQAVLRAYRGSKITSQRAVELLRGTLMPAELPPVAIVPREALRAEIADSA